MLMIRVCGLALLSLFLGACSAIGAIAANADREGSHKVPASVRALDGKSFAVLVQADRSIQGEHPLLLEYLTRNITQRLAASENSPRASGFVPADEVLKFTYDAPSWPLKSKAELSAALGGVERLVIVELIEYRLHDPGNRYVWDGRAAATVSVFEGSSSTSELALSEKSVSVRFPDSLGQAEEQLNVRVVNSALAQRLIDRVAWLFYDHEEPNAIKY
ncbi:MAG: hypothetical protein DYG92_13920 [Leptolyngbya sp. PLA1]|nr:hypothetical protein [Leptolyngbya sp. PLA1]